MVKKIIDAALTQVLCVDGQLTDVQTGILLGFCGPLPPVEPGEEKTD